MTPVAQIDPVDAETFERDIRPLYRPVVMRGLAQDWPAVSAARQGSDAALRYVEECDSRQPADIMLAPAAEKGRFFYAPDMRGFNFRRERLDLTGLAEHLRRIAHQDDPIGIYAGAVDARSHLPGFAEANALPLLDTVEAVPRIWLGNASQVATHFDLSDNVAVCVLGTRRFTLFPPEQTANLYVGPLNVTLAGQPVSMVDPLAPDTDRYPRFEEAEAHAQTVELEPGDALYIPTLWWHHVTATAPVNMLMNYWHNDATRGGGFLALIHAMLAIREQPAYQRKAWRAWFDHFVFDDDASDAAAHLPDHAKGVNGPATPQREEQILRFLVQVLTSR
ncbi:cupin-like domain-containing protein [Erythrobacter litoralis]|uniref:cupin-like domain-containing protein n=1 Tax=Erythrobacter litoralis TaxID=39960 RepID=UPI0024352543|nr:cupin-like domain-containing protein [Erythrobacter litoralis]MDG6079253.1 cupin-like domain-containing protein [Erythrobacter litoralis]